jgi:hypothetical protein
VRFLNFRAAREFFPRAQALRTKFRALGYRQTPPERSSGVTIGGGLPSIPVKPADWNSGDSGKQCVENYWQDPSSTNWLVVAMVANECAQVTIF